MIRLPRALSVWGSPDFDGVLKEEIERLAADQLPLQKGLSTTSYPVGEGFRVMVIGSSAADGFIRARAGIFYSGIVAGCNCADDPTPVEAQPEYCEVQIDIDRETAGATITLLGE